MKITIVTVCYNAEKTIERTIKSVLKQTYSNIQYLIIDGLSQDKTCDIIEKYLNDSRVHFISERDKGLYNAMNKGIDFAEGEYIIFMNSGDSFFNRKVLEQIAYELNEDIVYGNVLRKKDNGRFVEKYRGKNRILRLLLKGKMMSHQSMFVRTQILKNNRFDETYKICADYNLVARLYTLRYRFKYVNLIISYIDNIEGISSQSSNVNKMRQEDDRTLIELFTEFYYITYLPKKICRYIIDRKMVLRNGE